MTALIFTAILPIFSVIALGFLARQLGWIQKSADASLMACMLNLLFPALFFSLIFENPALRQAENLILPPLLGFFTVAAGMGLSLWLARCFKLGDSRERRTFSLSASLSASVRAARRAWAATSISAAAMSRTRAPCKASALMGDGFWKPDAA